MGVRDLNTKGNALAAAFTLGGAYDTGNLLSRPRAGGTGGHPVP